MTDSILNRPDTDGLSEWREPNQSMEGWDPHGDPHLSSGIVGSDSLVPARILVADDDPRIRTALGRRLEFAGYEVLTACDGAEALRVARSENPDLVVLDVSMPGYSGFSVAEAVREDPELDNMPIIFITGVDDPGYFDEAIHHRGIAFLGKPFDSETLLPLVESALEHGGIWR